MVSKMFRSVLSSLNGQDSTASLGPNECKAVSNLSKQQVDLGSTATSLDEAAVAAAISNESGTVTRSLETQPTADLAKTTSSPTISNRQEQLVVGTDHAIYQEPEVVVGRKVAQMVGKIAPSPLVAASDLGKLATVTEDSLEPINNYKLDNATNNKVGDHIQTNNKLVFGKDNSLTNNANGKSKVNTKRRLVSFVGKLHKSISHSNALANGNLDLIDADSKNNSANSISNQNSSNIISTSPETESSEQVVVLPKKHSERRRSSIWNLKMVGHLTGHKSDNNDSSKLANKNNTGTDDEAGDDDDHEEYSTHKNYNKGKFVLPEEECNIPTFLETKNCDPKLISETRRLLRERFAKNPENFYEHDFQRMLTEDWTVSRFLLRRRCDPKRTAKLMEECGRFRKQYKMSEVKLWEFPVEFHKAGGLFKYARDRVGNVTVYMRVKMYRRVPEISDVFKAFILCVLEEADTENDGRGTAVIFDLSSCGLQNVDLSFLSWLLSSFRNYCPKGVSYILVYNLPWILSATCKLAMTWMSASNRRALRFVHGQEIENFISRENLPDYLNGTCPLDYRKIPEGAKPAIEVCDRLDMTPEQAMKIRELFKEYIQD